MEPAVAALVVPLFTVECIKTNPEAAVVRVLHEFFKAVLFPCRPFSDAVLSGGFHNPPGVVPPAVIVVARFRRKYGRRCAGVFIVSRSGAENEQRSAFGHSVEKDFFLSVRFPSQDKDWFHIEWCDRPNVGTTPGRCDPVAILAKEAPD